MELNFGRIPLPWEYLSWKYLLPAIVVLVPLYIIAHDFFTWLHMPRGPLPLPFVGNRLEFPKSRPWFQFQEWSRIYGSIFTLWLGRTPMLVISDPYIAVDLMEKRSNKYSSRPRFVAMGELLWDGASMLVQPYGKAWSARRKLLHQALTPSALKLYKPTQEAEASRLCWHLLNSPDRYDKHIDRFTASVVFSIAYGHRIDSLDAQIVRQRLRFMEYLGKLNVPGAYMVESFPIMKYIPDILAPWKRDIKANGREQAQANMELVETVKSDIRQAEREGTKASPSLCKLILEVKEKEGIPLSDRDFAFVPGSLFGAGSDTTSSTLCSTILALITHPATLQAAHAELDSVVGSSRSPSPADEESLPYLRALCKEVLRWRPVAILGGMPHATSEDDEYQGYQIPKGTRIMGLTWAINMDDKYYPEPNLFEPLRFLDTRPPSYLPNTTEMEKKMARLKGYPHPSKTGQSSFGWGRRICPGEALSGNTLFIALSKMLWAFDFLPVEGKVYDTLDYTNNINTHPHYFPCQIVPRSQEHKDVLRGDFKNAETYLQRFPAFE